MLIRINVLLRLQHVYGIGIYFGLQHLYFISFINLSRFLFYDFNLCLSVLGFKSCLNMLNEFWYQIILKLKDFMISAWALFAKQALVYVRLVQQMWSKEGEKHSRNVFAHNSCDHGRSYLIYSVLVDNRIS